MRKINKLCRVLFVVLAVATMAGCGSSKNDSKSSIIVTVTDYSTTGFRVQP